MMLFVENITKNTNFLSFKKKPILSVSFCRAVRVRVHEKKNWVQVGSGLPAHPWSRPENLCLAHNCTIPYGTIAYHTVPYHTIPCLTIAT